jgi:hypothetical protein
MTKKQQRLALVATARVHGSTVVYPVERAWPSQCPTSWCARTSVTEERRTA